MRLSKFIFFACLILGLISQSYAFSSYKDIKLIPLGEKIIINGFPAKLYFFESSDNPERIIDYYSSYFKKNGQKFTKNSWGGMYILSAVKGKKIEGVLVIKDDKHGKNMVFLSSIDIEGKVNNNQPFYLKPGSRLLMDVISKDEGKVTRTYIASDNESISSNIKYYYRLFKSNLWSIESDQGDETKSHILIFKKNGKQCIATFHYSHEIKSTTVLIFMEE